MPTPEEEQAKAACLELSHKYIRDIPEWQHQANAEFFFRMWKMLAVGGVYGWPAAGRTFVKTVNGWREIDP